MRNHTGLRFGWAPPALAVLCVALLLAASPLHAQRDIEGATPHPAVPLPPGGYITLDEFVDFAIIDFPAGPRTRREEPEMLRVEGGHTRLEYTVDGTETATLRLYRTYLQHLQGQGFEILYTGFGDDLHDRRPLDFFSGTNLAWQAAATPDIGYILARSADETQVVAVAFYDRQRNRRIMVNVVDIEDLALLDLQDAEPGPEPEPEPEPEPAPAAPVVQQSAEELESGLIADGRVVVDAILFAFDSDEILPDSAAALQTVAALMDDRPGLTLLVVGHTDGVGSFDYNLRLSLSRATSVVDWLASRHGIARERLRPAGAGPMSPITTNRSEEGRALNRRVELVEVVQ